MPTKQEIYDSVDEFATYSGREVRDLIFRIHANLKVQPGDVKKGDVFMAQAGAKVRPVVVAKVQADGVWGIPLSRTEDHMTLMRARSRFYPDSYFTKCLVFYRTEWVESRWSGVFDNNYFLDKALNKILNTLS